MDSEDWRVLGPELVYVQSSFSAWNQRPGPFSRQGLESSTRHLYDILPSAAGLGKATLKPASFGFAMSD